MMKVDFNLGDTKLIVSECMRQGLLRNQTAYVLATAYWETGQTMEPIREAHGDSADQSIARLDAAWSQGRLSWVSRPYWRKNDKGLAYFGRGYVQLTHEVNYINAGNKLGLDLVSEPIRVMEPDIAVKIIVLGMREGWFTGKKLADYITLKASNYRGARRIVNGTDKAATIAELAREYEEELLAEGYGVEKSPPVTDDRRDGTAPRNNPVQSTTKQATIAGAVATVAGQSETVKEAVGNYSVAFGIAPQWIFAVLALAAFGWVFRERLRKWAEGDR